MGTRCPWWGRSAGASRAWGAPTRPPYLLGAAVQSSAGRGWGRGLGTFPFQSPGAVLISWAQMGLHFSLPPLSLVLSSNLADLKTQCLSKARMCLSEHVRDRRRTRGTAAEGGRSRSRAPACGVDFPQPPPCGVQGSGAPHPITAQTFLREVAQKETVSAPKSLPTPLE